MPPAAMGEADLRRCFLGDRSCLGAGPVDDPSPSEPGETVAGDTLGPQAAGGSDAAATDSQARGPRSSG
jgi:hypothetical protein